MFYSQPLATRFGNSLISHIQSGTWRRFDIAVAWVRATGLRHLEPALRSYLEAGNELTVVVGVDLDNTTKEGLVALLDLENYGASSTFIHHNESGTIFHPKLYLFRGENHAKLIVGSNNITEAGLYRNTEAGLEIEATTTDKIIVTAVNALDSWKDTSLGLARKLDRAFLNDLLRHGYIKEEAAVKAEWASRRVASSVRESTGGKLFGAVSVTPPARPDVSGNVTTTRQPGAKPNRAPKLKPAATAAPQVPISSAAGQVLLMRLRKARRTQVQIPLAVMSTPFFKGAQHVLSVATNVTRGIRPTHAARARAGANPNTLKLEMPETRNMTDPVARFERTSVGIQYEVYDQSTPKGQAIVLSLQAGLVNTPPSTYLTVPSSPSISTWWRFI